MVLDLLQIPFDAKEDIRMNELMRLAHQFLQNFCLANQNNQVSSFNLLKWRKEVLEFKDEIHLRQNQAQQELRFSVAKATLQSQMYVRPFVHPSPKPLNSLKSSSFIILHSFILHFTTFKHLSLFIFRYF